jgi:stearoyl-CoA desaturase (delta-9 desaturase)
MGWILNIQPIHHDPAVLRRYVPDLIQDRFHVALSTWNWVPQVVVALAFYAFGGVPYLLWAVFFRTTFGLHATSLVNSATHLWGSRRFMTRDDSTNSWWVSLLTFGEGWHNNHHAHPVSMRHGLAWYEIDVNYYGIKTLELLGLAWDLKAASLPNQAHEPAQASPDAVDVSAAEPALTDERAALMER